MQADRYPTSSVVLHWLTVLFIVLTVGFGSQLENPPEGWGDALYRLHWSCGLTVLLLTALRIVNRLVAGAPPPYAGLTSIERIASTAVHHALYVLLVAAPLLGWLGKSAYGGDITVFGLFNMPPLLGQDEALSKKLLGAHKVAVFLLIGAIALHIAGALNHVLIKKDGVFARMWPGS